MEIKVTNILEFLNNTQVLYSTEFAGEYVAPVDLLENILENSSTQEPLNFGVLFLNKINNDSYIVIDGLKRLISFSLFLHALCECYKMTNEKNDHAISLIKKRYLFGKLGTKIQLNGYEKEIYEKIVKYEKMSFDEKEHTMFKTLHDFWAKITMNNLSAVQLFKQIKNTNFVICTYENCEVENRDLYQYLNCNNSYIEEIRLITNFIEEKAGEYATYWYEIIEMFKNADMERKIKYFFLDFLTIQKNGVMPKENEIFFSFKRYYLKMINSGLSLKNLFDVIKTSAEHYIKISNVDFGNAEIEKRIHTLKDNNLYETFPYILEVTDDYENKLITAETFCQLLDTVILFIAEQKSGGFKSTINFGNLSHEINCRMQSNKTDIK